ncbi:MAG: hypothetical protein NTX61_04360 [Bacteroidetes bacterium]|nr:hypothetical protein [Bacteroidota bacterium]
MNRIIILTVSLIMVLSTSGQSKKERKKDKIKSTTEFETTFINGVSTTYKSSFEEYEKSGKVLTKIEFSPEGSILTKETAKYDQSGNKTEETQYDAAKKKNVKKTYKYNAFKDKTEEVEYGLSGTVVKKIVFSYNADGIKTTEVVTDAAGNVIKKMVYTYNPKKLKTNKQTFNNTNALEEEKKWEYEYY